VTTVFSEASTVPNGTPWCCIERCLRHTSTENAALTGTGCMAS
jgi:hypothetical protein